MPQIKSWEVSDDFWAAVAPYIPVRQRPPTRTYQRRAATLDSLLVPPPEPTDPAPKNLCADAGYKGPPALEIIGHHHYTPHVKQRREEAEAKQIQPDFKARRWGVERPHSWFNRFRKWLVSFEKTEASYLALRSLAAAMICWRQIISIYG
jgi:transposase